MANATETTIQSTTLEYQFTDIGFCSIVYRLVFDPFKPPSWVVWVEESDGVFALYRTCPDWFEPGMPLRNLRKGIMFEAPKSDSDMDERLRKYLARENLLA